MANHSDHKKHNKKPDVRGSASASRKPHDLPDWTQAPSLQPVFIQHLLVNPADHPRGQAHLSAASGLVRRGRRFVVVADEVHHLKSPGGKQSKAVAWIGEAATRRLGMSVKYGGEVDNVLTGRMEESLRLPARIMALS